MIMHIIFVNSFTNSQYVRKVQHICEMKKQKSAHYENSTPLYHVCLLILRQRIAFHYEGTQTEISCCKAAEGFFDIGLEARGPGNCGIGGSSAS